MPAPDLAADARTLWRLLRGQPRGASHAANLQAFYAPQAERYDAFRARLLHGRRELLDELDLAAGSHVVELGCGTPAAAWRRSAPRHGNWPASTWSTCARRCSPSPANAAPTVRRSM